MDAKVDFSPMSADDAPARVPASQPTAAHAAIPETRIAQMASKVRAFTAADAARWDAFVERCPDATFFHRIGWRGLIEDVFRHRTHYLLAERDGELTGVLPLAEVKSRLFGHALVSLPFAVYGGPAATDAQAAQALVDAAVERAQALGVEHLELRDRSPLRPDWPQQDLYVTFRKPILADVDANLAAIPRKQRAMVRKGIKNGLASVIDASADRFFELYADNMHRHGTPPFGRRYFERLLDVFGDAAEVLTVLDGSGRPVSGVLSFYFRDEVLPYYAGDTLAARELAANDFKYWELMRRACERGLTTFDYGRSKRGTGSFDFKKNWGFEPTPLAYEYRLLRRASIPENNPANPKFRAFIALWRRLPRPAVVALGPHIVRNLG
jgi:FemAB-related protein (PEP-CTERM system-associated)